ncbi:DDE-type integrase/transposase/recombinase [Streptomyces coelicoflavus]|uniref:DDE-type integrase/transposase/recombinase n=1 Tax=Streptomyces coelicoflavus TaxID=285562 RepID=UPI0036630146
MPESSAPRPPDLVDRDFTASQPDQLWVADMTYVRTWSGWAYVAFVLDVFSWMVAGWQIANHMRTELPLEALEMALWRRRVKKDSGLIHHSDRGSQGEFVNGLAIAPVGGLETSPQVVGMIAPPAAR